MRFKYIYCTEFSTKFNGMEMRTPGQLLKHEEREPTPTPAILGKRINEKSHTNIRTNIIN